MITLKVKNLEEKINLKSKYSNVSLGRYGSFSPSPIAKKKKYKLHSIKVVYDDLSLKYQIFCKTFSTMMESLFLVKSY